MATAPIAAFLATSLKQASDQADALSQLQAVIKSTGGVAGVTAEAANKLADSLSTVTRFSDDAILSGENMLLTFTNIGKDIFPQATKTALNMSQALGQDLKSSAIQLGKALNDPIKGVTALQRVGVTFTQAQKDMIQSLVDAGDVMGAQKVILAELEKEFGGSAEAAGTTFAGKMDILQHKFENFQETIGNLLMPILSKGMDAISGFIDRLVEWTDANPVLAQAITLVAGGLVVLGPLLITVGGAVAGLGAIVKAVSAGGFLAELFAPAIAAITPLLPLIAAVVAALAALKLAYDNNFLGFKDTVDGIVDKLEYLGRAAPVYLNTLVFYFDYYFRQIWDKVGPVLQPLYDWFTKTALPAIISYIQTEAGPKLAAFFAPIAEAWDTVKDSLSHLLDWFNKDGMPVIVKIVTERVIPAVQQMISWIQQIWTLVQPFVQAFVNGMTTLLGGLNNNVISPVVTNLQNIISTLQILAGLGMFSGNPGASLLLSGAKIAVPTKDSGGHGAAGMPQLIGTGAQPELFVPDSAGTFYPNAGATGGKSLTLNGDVVVQFHVTDKGLDLNNPDHVEQIGMAVLNAIMA